MTENAKVSQVFHPLATPSRTLSVTLEASWFLISSVLWWEVFVEPEQRGRDCLSFGGYVSAIVEALS